MSMFEQEEKVFAPREVIEEGKYTGLLTWVIDCGSVRDIWQGKEKIKHQIYCCWELPETTMADGRPFVIGNFYNITAGKFGPYLARTSNLHKLLRVWTGEDEKACSRVSILGKLAKADHPCTITIENQESKKNPGTFYSIIESVKPFKGKKAPTRVNPVLLYGPVGSQIPDEMPEWLRKRIAGCLELTTGVPARVNDTPEPDNDTDAF